MPDLSDVTTPVEWVVTHASSSEPIAVIRRLRLGPQRGLYFRAVTWHVDPATRDLIGYWGSAEEAVQNVYGLFERSLPPELLRTGSGTARDPLPLTKPKAPPARPESRHPSRPERHPSRQLSTAGR